MTYSLKGAEKYEIQWTGGWFNYRRDEFQKLLDNIPDLKYIFPNDDEERVEIIANNEGNFDAINISILYEKMRILYILIFLKYVAISVLLRTLLQMVKLAII
jgi:hypothetical protein